MPRGKPRRLTDEERAERAAAFTKRWHDNKRKERRERGLCWCGKERKDGSTQCERHWAISREYNFNYRFELRLQALEAYGGKCACCGENTPEFLQFDHKNNDGYIHRKNNTARGGIALWLKQNGYPDTIQLLCGNCHAAKSFYGRCPHEGYIKDSEEYVDEEESS